MRDLVLRLKEVKDKDQQEEDTERLDERKQRRFSSPQQLFENIYVKKC